MTLTPFKSLDSRGTFQTAPGGTIYVKVTETTFGTAVDPSPTSNGVGEIRYYTGETNVRTIGGQDAMVFDTGQQIAETKDW